MFKNIKWLRLVPDKPGKGGWKTGYHTFQAQPVNDTRQAHGVHLYRGRWRRDYKSQTPSVGYGGPAIGVAPAISLHVYSYPSLTDPSASQSITILSHLQLGGPVNTYYDFTTNTARNVHAGGSIGATFLNIDGRCFIADGAREGFIADDRTPAVHAQRNQNLGVGTPAQMLQVDATSAPTPYGLYGYCYLHDQSGFLTNPDPNSMLGTVLVGETVHPFLINPTYPYYAGALSVLWPTTPVGNAVTSNTTPFTNTGTLTVTNGSAIVTLVGWTWPSLWRYCGLTINFAGRSYILWETYENTGGSNVCFDLNGNVITLAAGQALLMGEYDGPSMSGVPYTITGCQLNMSVGTSAVTMNNSPANTLGYGQATGSRTIKAGFYITPTRNMGNLSWLADQGPKYAYAWYDPETGHMSNISPIYAISSTYTPATDVTPNFAYGPGYISYPTGFGTPPTSNTDGVRFSHIVFFRTVTGGGSTLYPIGSLQPYISKSHPGSAATRGSWNPKWMGFPNDYCNDLTNYPGRWADFSTDEDLILSGGFRAPQYTNEKPMVTLPGGATEVGKVAHQAYWDRRLWVVCTQEPTKVAFSCDEAQCPLGIPVESFPPMNYLRIPSVDGKVVGMKTVGEMLLITTERWAYTVAGNNESNYRLLRVSTRLGGVGYYQMSEITSDVEGQSSIVYFLGRDKIIYEWVVGGAVTPISEPIQNILNSAITTLSSYRSVRLHCVSAWARRAVILSFGYYGTVGFYYMFDLLNRVWTEHFPDQGGVGGTTYGQQPSAMTTVYGLDPPVEELYSVPDAVTYNVTAKSWMRDDTSTQEPGMFGTGNGIIETFPLNFDGLKTRKQLVMVNVHASNNATGTYTAYVRTNESSTSASATMTTFPDPAYSTYATPATPVDVSTAKDLVVLTAGFKADGSALVGYRFVVGIETTNYDTPTEIYAIDIGYIDWEEPGEGDP